MLLQTRTQYSKFVADKNCDSHVATLRYPSASLYVEVGRGVVVFYTIAGYNKDFGLNCEETNKNPDPTEIKHQPFKDPDKRKHPIHHGASRLLRDFFWKTLPDAMY